MLEWSFFTCGCGISSLTQANYLLAESAVFLLPSGGFRQSCLLLVFLCGLIAFAKLQAILACYHWYILTFWCFCGLESTKKPIKTWPSTGFLCQPSTGFIYQPQIRSLLEELLTCFSGEKSEKSCFFSFSSVIWNCFLRPCSGSISVSFSPLHTFFWLFRKIHRSFKMCFKFSIDVCKAWMWSTEQIDKISQVIHNCCCSRLQEILFRGHIPIIYIKKKAC